jgi:outer membrane lipoprotein carrier protein
LCGVLTAQGSGLLVLCPHKTILAKALENRFVFRKSQKIKNHLLRFRLFVFFLLIPNFVFKAIGLLPNSLRSHENGGTFIQKFYSIAQKPMMKTLFMAACCLFFSALLSAQENDPKADATLKAMADKYKKIKAFQADFTLASGTDAKIKEELKGSITVKGEKYRIKIGDQEIFNNSKTVWNYKKKENEVTVSPNEADEDDLTPTKIYSMYKKGFKYNLIETATIDGKACEVIDLTPIDKKKEFFKVRLTIEQASKTLKSWKIFEKSGSRYLYTITNFKGDITVEDAVFNFDKSKYPGVEVVDLN